MRVRIVHRSTALLAGMLSVSGQALATDATDMVVPQDKRAILSWARLVSDTELAGMRGGFFTAAGAQFDFGASIRTMVNGQLALQTNLKWTPSGPVTQQLTGLGAQIQSQVNDTVAKNLALAGIASPLPSPGTAAAQTAGSGASRAPAQAPMPAAAPVPMPAAASIASSGNSTALSSSSPSTAPSVIAPSSTAAASPAVTAALDPSTLLGVQVPGQGGSTQVFANVGGGQIQNIIMNSANGQDITQNTNIMLTIYNYQAWQAQLADRMVAARLASDVLAASGLSAGH